MNFTIDREKFKELLSQFRGDIIYQTELLHTILNQLPDAYVDDIVRTLYYERLFIGTYYEVQHTLYKQDKRIFLSFSEVQEFLNEVRLDDKVVGKFALANAIQNGNSISGYIIRKIIRTKEDK